MPVSYSVLSFFCSLNLHIKRTAAFSRLRADLGPLSARKRPLDAPFCSVNHRLPMINWKAVESAHGVIMDDFRQFLLQQGPVPPRRGRHHGNRGQQFLSHDAAIWALCFEASARSYKVQNLVVPAIANFTRIAAP